MHNQSGLSIVATVMVMMILALFAAAAVSLITTAAGTGIQEERGTQAFYIAEGGMQYTLKKNTYPYYAVDIYTSRRYLRLVIHCHCAYPGFKCNNQ